MADNSFKIKNSLVLTPVDLATLTNPQAGDLACDINDNNKIKRYDAASTSWTEVGSGGVGGVDIFFVQDFESVSLSSFTQTGLVLSQTEPLKGKVSALLTHQAAINQSFKQVIPVDRKFRGETMTLRLNVKSSASTGNVTINIYDETNAANIVASEQLQLSNDVSGAISRVGFTIPETCASISYTIIALPEAGSPVTRIDDIICELAETALLETVVELTGNAQTLTIPLTQSGLVRGVDSSIKLRNFTSYGSTATKIPRFSILDLSLGGDITYTDSVTDGASFTVQTSGTYTFNFGFSANTTHALAISKNPTAGQKTTDASSLTGSEILARASGVAGNISGYVSWTGDLVAGDIIYPHTNGVASSGGNESRAIISASRQGSIKQVAVSSDQKITIPTSELRFEGSSSRGSTATAIVRFDTLAKLRGDAFTVESDAVFGTRITMKKAGKLDISTSIRQSSSGTYFAISRNQANLTAVTTTPSEVLAFANPDAGTSYESMSWSGFVSVGDVIRVCAGANPTSDGSQSLNLSLQEQSVSVSVTNTLPQFSESDSSIRVDTANGYGSTGTKIRRFSNTRDNIGSDINYVDDAASGASFTVRTSGVYEISYTENTSGTVAYFAITKNASSLTTNPDGLTSAERLALGIVSTAGYPVTISAQAYLTAGDIIRPQSSAQAAGTNAFVAFTISKVGKPNVTGVNVTPFVNVPQPEWQSSFLSSTANVQLANVTGSLTTQGGTSSSIYSYNSTSGVYTFLKQARVTASLSLQNVATNSTVAPQIALNGTVVSLDNSVPTADYRSNATWTGSVNVGDTLTFSNPNNSASKQTYASLMAEANSDQILTAPETFSSDTAALQYASSSLYNLTTLANAPVGTYITFTYAANTNTRTQTSTRPTQTDADMNANGVLLYTRAYNAASTAAQPAIIAIQLGKGLKGVTNTIYKSAGKATTGSLDNVLDSSTAQAGAIYKEYNESTGILLVDVGLRVPTVTSSYITYSDGTNQSSGYLVISASKNPALTGFGLNRVAARAVSSSGQSIPNNTLTAVTWDSAKTFDTAGIINTSTGVVTITETGYYQVNLSLALAAASWALNTVSDLHLYKNGSTITFTRFSSAAYTQLRQMRLAEVVYLTKGDTLQAYIFQNNGAPVALHNDVNTNSISIVKVSI